MNLTGHTLKGLEHCNLPN
ncbi:hypothetical protein Zm00014a_020561 [Zea mays]|uniref:Uncharacterized protein n=1 Tax=Zea mays TaxID=4577 RepID=A0A3L6DRR4_MAIZE|nr:hypothetical protein Zm00014a_020561 [Zea mays]